VRAVLNLADPGDNADTADTLEALAGFSQFTVTDTVIRRRKAIANAMAHGPSQSRSYSPVTPRRARKTNNG